MSKDEPKCPTCGGSKRVPQAHCKLTICDKHHLGITCKPNGKQCEHYIPGKPCPDCQPQPEQADDKGEAGAWPKGIDHSQECPHDDCATHVQHLHDHIDRLTAELAAKDKELAEAIKCGQEHLEDKSKMQAEITDLKMTIEGYRQALKGK